MAEPKDTTSFFRKVVKFVANPATEWAELDTPSRRHARERVRQGRAEGDDRAQAAQRFRPQARIRHAAQGAPRRPDRASSSPRSAARPGSTTPKPRIADSRCPPGRRRQGQDRRDRAADGRRRLRQHAAPRARVLQRADPAGAAWTAARRGRTGRGGRAGTSAARRPVDDSPLAPPPAARRPGRRRAAAATRLAGADRPRHAAGRAFGNAFGRRVTEVTHDPDLDEAVIAFANADFEQCEQSLASLTGRAAPLAACRDLAGAVRPLPRDRPAAQVREPGARLRAAVRLVGAAVVLDAASWSPRPRATSGRRARASKARSAGSARTISTPTASPSWLARAADAAALGVRLERAAQIDAEACGAPVASCSAAGSRRTSTCAGFPANACSRCCRKPRPPAFATPTRRTGSFGWMRCAWPTGPTSSMRRRSTTASPTRSRRLRGSGALHGARQRLEPGHDAPPLSVVSDVSTSFLESQLTDDTAHGRRSARVELSGQLVGDIGTTLKKMDSELGTAKIVNVSCARLIRVDFIAAGDLLNWVLARRSENRTVQLRRRASHGRAVLRRDGHQRARQRQGPDDLSGDRRGPPGAGDERRRLGRFVRKLYLHLRAMINCPKCNEENPPKFRLCGYCGAPLSPPRRPLPVREVRRTVTIIFCDLKGSTALGERLDPEALHEVKDRYFTAMAAEITRHGGKIEKYIGDAIMAVFGLPLPHEDDALRAVRAAAGMQAALQRVNVDLRRATASRSRTGPASTPARSSPTTTRPPTRSWPPATPSTSRRASSRRRRRTRSTSARHLSPGARRGRGRGGRAARAEGQERAGAPRTGWSRRAGLDGYARRARQHDRRPRGRARGDRPGAARGRSDTRTARLVTIIGDAGMGKSRLAREVIAARRAAARASSAAAACTTATASRSGRCATSPASAADIRFDDSPEEARAKLAALVGDDDVAARIAAAIGLSDGRVPAARDQLGGAQVPRDAGGATARWSRSSTTSTGPSRRSSTCSSTCSTRPRTRRSCCSRPRATTCSRSGPTGATGRRSLRLVLRPLTDAAAARVAENLLGAPACRPTSSARIVEAAEGNPLYVEQILSMLVDTKALRQERRPLDARRELWRDRDPADDQGAARGAPRPARPRGAHAIEPASVIGLQFAAPAVASLAPERVRADIDEHLAALTRKQLVHAVPVR